MSTANSYDFVGDDREDATETIAYNGGFYNKEWFKKNVLNLSGTSRYESGTATGDDIDTLKIEVTTLTLQELADWQMLPLQRRILIVELIWQMWICSIFPGSGKLRGRAVQYGLCGNRDRKAGIWRGRQRDQNRCSQSAGDHGL